MPNNDARRQAEDQIKRLAKDPQVVPALIEHLRTAKTLNVRQLAAVLLREKTTGHLDKLSPDVRAQVKQSLIESITSPPVGRASANVVSIISKYSVPSGEWKELLPFLFQCSKSPQEDHREVALILFSSLIETIGESFRPHFTDLQSLLLKCLQDETSTRVTVAALKSVGSFLEFTLKNEAAIKFQEFIPSILNVSRKCLASGEEDVAMIAFEIFDELIESPVPLLGDSVKAIVQLSLDVCANPNLDSNTCHREGIAKIKEVFDTMMNIYMKTMTEDDAKEVVAQACMSLADIFKDFRYMAIEPYMTRLVESTLVLLREESACQQVDSNKEIDEDDTKHDEVLMDAVSDLLPVFATVLGNQFASVFLRMSRPLMKFSKQSRPHEDRTMVVETLAEVTRHMSDPFAGYVDHVIPLVLKELGSPTAINRRNAAFSVGELCKNGGSAVLIYYADILNNPHPLFGESEPDYSVRDNAAGAVAKMIMAHPESIPLNQGSISLENEQTEKIRNELFHVSASEGGVVGAKMWRKRRKCEKSNCNGGSVLSRRGRRHRALMKITAKMWRKRGKCEKSKCNEGSVLSRRGRKHRALIKITEDMDSCSAPVMKITEGNVKQQKSNNRRQTCSSETIFLEDSRSLLDCQLQLQQPTINRCLRSESHQGKADQPSKINDSICSICHYGCELTLCVRCPSAFHTHCLGLEGVPEGDWFCPSCCCQICGQGSLDIIYGQFSESFSLVCGQCEQRYHVECLRDKRIARVDCCLEGHWFCQDSCKQIYLGLRMILWKPISVGTENMTWTLVKYEGNTSHDEHMMENYSKLNVALSVMHECFEPVREPDSKRERDLVEDVIFSRWSELKRLNFQGFYTVILEKNDELISAANVRILGKKVAEVPLVATRLKYRRLGMCRVLVNELEENLKKLGVERLVLPAFPSLVNIWTTSFGFSLMNQAERLSFLNNIFLDFPGTVICQKILTGTQLTSCGHPSIKLDGNNSVSEVFQVDQVGEIEISEEQESDISEEEIDISEQDFPHDHSKCLEDRNDYASWLCIMETALPEVWKHIINKASEGEEIEFSEEEVVDIPEEYLLHRLEDLAQLIGNSSS